MPKKVSFDNKKFELFILSEKIEHIVKNLAEKINRDYRNRNPIIYVTLKGAMIFASDLIRELIIDCKIETISAKSYGMGLRSSGNIEIKEDEFDLENKDIILVEDIIDSGATAMRLKNFFMSKNPKSFTIVSLLSKPEARIHQVEVKYLGIEIPNRFVIGYGLDYAEFGRNLPDIYILIQ